VNESADINRFDMHFQYDQTPPVNSMKVISHTETKSVEFNDYSEKDIVDRIEQELDSMHSMDQI
jgi:hypothetical protein